MKLTLESTQQMSEVNGVPGRVWVGRTERGVEVQALITRVAVHNSADHSQFEAELREAHAPAPKEAAFPLRMVL